MRRSATFVAALALLAAIATLRATPKTPAQASCSFQPRDADGDMLRSDGAGLDVMSYRSRISSPEFLDSFGQFTGDSSYDAGPAIVGTSSLFFATIDACTWIRIIAGKPGCPL